MSRFYFSEFEDRKPEPPVPHSPAREALWQILATMAIVVGGWYITWRWTSSLNWDALWFAVPVAAAETLAYFGMILFIINLWANRDVPRKAAPRLKSEVMDGVEERPIDVDVFFPTYDEDPELVRLSVRDAKRLSYPHPINIKIFVLDDGRRPAMEAMAAQEGVGYITRPDNIGFKAGNLRNAMERTSGDFIVICDADTRPFPTMLAHTLGYFRDRDVAWVQTPQWFFDIPEGKRLPASLRGSLGRVGQWLGEAVEAIAGRVEVGRDPFDNDPKMFYDIIQRRRNAVNASFCCGAGSVHRREAVVEAALKGFSAQISEQVDQYTDEVDDEALKGTLSRSLRQQAVQDTEFTPYKFHVSEDIYTSLILHSDPERNWKSVLHPQVESKMLSPQDLQAWVVQRFKYAGGSLDIAINDSKLMGRGLSFWQKCMYAATFFPYLSCTWNVIFLLAPVVYLFTGVAPVQAYSMDFFIRILPFLFLNELAMMVGTWGVNNAKGKAFYLAFFPIGLRALATVLRGEKIKFPTTPKDRQTGTFLHLVRWQLAVIILTVVGLIYGWTSWAMEPDHAQLTALIANMFWGLNNIAAMMVMVRAAVWQPEGEEPVEMPATEAVRA